MLLSSFDQVFGDIHQLERFARWQAKKRRQLLDLLGIPSQSIPLELENRGLLMYDDITIEKWVYTSEHGSRVPAILYRPNNSVAPMPGVVLTFGHGGSKSQPAYNYAGQLYAKMGIACLAADPIGEEERHIQGKMGTRAHDPHSVHQTAWNAGRPIMGKLVWDTMRGVDFMLDRDDIDPHRIGVVGNSLGGAKAGWMAVLDTRLHFALISGWAFAEATLKWGKFCTRLPNEKMSQILDWEQYLSLAAPHCNILIMNGDADIIIDRDGHGHAWREMQAVVDKVSKVYMAFNNPNGIRCWLEPDGGHRPYFVHPAALEWLVELLSPDSWTIDQVRQLSTLNFGQWGDTNGVAFEQLYGTTLHQRGATVSDLQIRYLGREKLAVLTKKEIGRSRYTLQGWLNKLTATL